MFGEEGGRIVSCGAVFFVLLRLGQKKFSLFVAVVEVVILYDKVKDKRYDKIKSEWL